MGSLISSLEKIGFGEALLFMLIGMAIIIAVLSLLVGLLYIIRYAVAAIEKPKKAKAESSAPVQTEQSETENDEETVAAITAAITCILQSEQKDETVVAPFIIKKIKHIH